MVSEILSPPMDENKTGNINDYLGKPVTEFITNGFFTVNRKWTVLYWNKGAENLLGVKAIDIVGKNLWDNFAGVIPLNFYAVYHKAFLSDIPVHFKEYWAEMGTWFDVITYHDNDILSVSFKSSNKKYPGGRVHPEQQLKMLNNLYRIVSEVTNDCLWEWDLQAKEQFWIDGGHKRVFGYQIENALIPQSFWESLVHPDDKVRILTNLNKRIAEGAGSVWEDEYRFKKANGEYAYVNDRGHIIYEADGKAVRMIGATQDITPRKLAQIQLMDSEKKLTLMARQRAQEITHLVLTAQEKERAVIGRELHDNLNQILGATKLYIEMAKVDDESRDICLNKSLEFIVTVIKEIRRIGKNLAPPVMIMGLGESIKGLLEDLIMIHPIKIEFRPVAIDEESLSKDLQLNIFRIVQEQLNNIVKHSRATSAIINLSKHDNEIILLVSDNGAGCDVAKKAAGVGIINIRNRAELYQGSVTIVSTPGQGYKLNVVFPCNVLANMTK